MATTTTATTTTPTTLTAPPTALLARASRSALLALLDEFEAARHAMRHGRNMEGSEGVRIRSEWARLDDQARRIGRVLFFRFEQESR